MKKLLLFTLLLSGFLAASQNQTVYPLKVSESSISWRGYYTFLFSDHQGTVNFKSGELYSMDGNVSGGEFVIDMTSISNADYLEGKGPVQHLKDTDFFHVAKYPTATLKINSVEYFPEENLHKIMADLTIKGITKTQELWATIDGDTRRFTSKFKIDRTRWGITHNNELRDHAIADAIEFVVFLQF